MSSPSLQMAIGNICSNRSSNLVKIKDLTEQLNSCTVEENDLLNFWSQSLDLFAVISADGELLEVNDAWCQLLGYNTDELLKSHILGLIHPSDIAITQNIMLTKNDEKARFHNRLRTKSGDYLCLEWSCTFVNEKLYAVARPVPYTCIECPETSMRSGFRTTRHGKHA